MRLAISFLSLLIVNQLNAQCPIVDFAMPSDACLNENIEIINLMAADSLVWDFCSNDFGVNPKIDTLFSFNKL